MQEMNYILNDDRIKNRPTFLTWLFFNKSLRKLCLSSLESLNDDLGKLCYLKDKADATRDLDATLKLTPVIIAMNDLWKKLVNYGYCNRRLKFMEIVDLKTNLEVIEELISEVV